MNYIRNLILVGKIDKEAPTIRNIWIFRPWVQIFMFEYLGIGSLLHLLVLLVFGFRLYYHLFLFFLYPGLTLAKRTFWYFYDVATSKNFKDDVCLVTGGAGGLGREICFELLEDNPKAIIIWDINDELLEKTVLELEERKKEKKFQTRIFGNIVDVSNYEMILEHAEKIEEELGSGVDVLINNAGIFSTKRLLDTNPKSLKKVMEVNATSHLYTMKVFLPNMLKKKHGHITAISSSAGIVGGSLAQEYCASKFAAFGALDSLRLDLKNYYKMQDHIHTTIVCPHLFDSQLFSKARTNIVERLLMSEIARRTVDGMRKKRDILLIPQYFAWTYVHRFMAQYWFNGHIWYGDWWQHLLGINEVMDDWETDKEKVKKDE